MSDRIINPHDQPDQFRDRRHGVQTRRDLSLQQVRQVKNQERQGLEIQDETRILARLVNRLRFTGQSVTASIVGDVAVVDVDVDTTVQTRATEIDLCAQPQHSGRFELEDSDITDDSVVLIQHVGADENDDEPEMDGVQFYPNPAMTGRVRGSWHAMPGPISGSVHVRYLIAAAS